MADKRLGKGLAALIPDISSDNDEQRTESIRDIEVSRVSTNPYQPREEFDQDALEELKNSIAEKTAR